MKTANANPTELLLVQDPLRWPEVLLIGLVVFLVSVVAIVAPRRRGRAMMVTDVLEESAAAPHMPEKEDRPS